MANTRLEILKKYYKKNRRLPSYSEMLKLFNLSSKNSVFKIVNKWIDENFLKKINGKLSPTSRFFALPFLAILKPASLFLPKKIKTT